MLIFVSSPLGETDGARDAAETVIRDLGLEVYRFETAGAEAVPPLERCLERVRSCDVFISILGPRYGLVPAPHNAFEWADGRTSISEIEFRYAESLGKPVLIYIADDIELDQRQAEFIGSLRDLYVSSTAATVASEQALIAALKRDLPRLITQLVRREYIHPAAGRPVVHVYKTEQDMYRAAADRLLQGIAKQPWPVVTLGAGRTTAGVYAETANRAHEIDPSRIDNIRFIGQTEYLGYHPSHPNSCGSHLRTTIVGKLRRHGSGDIADRDIFLPSTVHTGTLEAVCSDIDAQLSRELIHVSIFGVSPEGEIACVDAEAPNSNEPLGVGTTVVRLSDSARMYVSPRPLLPYVLTIGLKHIARSELMMAVVAGAVKAEVVRQLINGPVDSTIPVTLLRRRDGRRLEVYADEPAAAHLSDRQANVIRHE